MKLNLLNEETCPSCKKDTLICSCCNGVREVMKKDREKNPNWKEDMWNHDCGTPVITLGRELWCPKCRVRAGH